MRLHSLGVLLLSTFVGDFQSFSLQPATIFGAPTCPLNNINFAIYSVQSGRVVIDVIAVRSRFRTAGTILAKVVSAIRVPIRLRNARYILAVATWAARIRPNFLSSGIVIFQVAARF